MEPVPPPIITVGEELPCARCGYSLSGLAIGGKCPECGWPIEASLRGRLLEVADPAYLDALARGVLIVICCTIANVVLSFAAFLVAAVLASMLVFRGGPTWADAAMEMFIAIGVMIGAAVTLASAYGYWQLTAPDPGTASREQPGAARRLARATIVASVACSLASSLLNLTYRGGAAAGPMAVQVAEAGLSLLGTLAWAVHFFAMMLYVRWLAARVPDAGIVEQTRLYIWLLPVLTVVGVMCLGLGPLVAMVLYLIMLWNLRRRILACRGLALKIGT
jgi:hypothetical protein